MNRDLVDWFLVGGAIVLGIAFLAGQWRFGRIRGATAALEVQHQEIEALRDQNGRLQTELTATRSEVDTMRGTVDQLREENAALRELLMGAKVQPALYQAMEQVAASSVAAGSEALAEQLRPVVKGLEQVLAALARKGDLG